MVLKNNKKFIISALFFFVASIFSFAAEVPALKGRINDYADVIDSDDEAQLNEYLTRLDDQTGIQIAVLTVPTIDGESIETYSMRVAESWKLGQKGEDNGALVVLALEEHDIRIEVGYGLEGVLTDTKCGLILRNVIIPEFKDGDYSEGILKGVSNIVGIVLDDEELVDKDVLNEKESENSWGIVFMVFWIIFIIIIITSKGGLWKWLFVSNVARRTNVYRTFNSNSSNFGSGSSFSGGSNFSGGGGSFGGGGASGHW